MLLFDLYIIVVLYHIQLSNTTLYLKIFLPYIPIAKARGFTAKVINSYWSIRRAEVSYTQARIYLAKEVFL